MVNIAPSMTRVDRQLARQPEQLPLPLTAAAGERVHRRPDAEASRPPVPSSGAGRSTALSLPVLLGVAEVAARYRCSSEAAEAIMHACGAFTPSHALLVRSDRVDDWERSHTLVEPERSNRSVDTRGEDATLLTAAEVAALCACSRKTVYRAIGRGDLAATRMGSHLRVSRPALLVWIAAQARPRPRVHADSTETRLDGPVRNARRIRSLVAVESKERASSGSGANAAGLATASGSAAHLDVRTRGRSIRFARRAPSRAACAFPRSAERSRSSTAAASGSATSWSSGGRPTPRRSLRPGLSSSTRPSWTTTCCPGSETCDCGSCDPRSSTDSRSICGAAASARRRSVRASRSSRPACSARCSMTDSPAIPSPRCASRRKPAAAPSSRLRPSESSAYGVISWRAAAPAMPRS
jgi:excisionase family DNA binding protein